MEELLIMRTRAANARFPYPALNKSLINVLHSLPYPQKKILESKTFKSMTRKSISVKCFSPERLKPVYTMKRISGTETPAPKKSLHSPFHIYSRNILRAKQSQLPNTKQMHNEITLK